MSAPSQDETPDALDREFALDRSRVELADTFEQADARDRAFWHAQTPDKQLRYLEYLRRLNYGKDRAAARPQRVLEIAE